MQQGAKAGTSQVLAEMVLLIHRYVIGLPLDSWNLRTLSILACQQHSLHQRQPV